MYVWNTGFCWVVPQVAELNRRGNLLVTYGHAWVQGEMYVKCVDFNTGENVEIQISAGDDHDCDFLLHCFLFSSFICSFCGKESISELHSLVFHSVLL